MFCTAHTGPGPGHSPRQGTHFTTSVQDVDNYSPGVLRSTCIAVLISSHVYRAFGRSVCSSYACPSLLRRWKLWRFSVRLRPIPLSDPGRPLIACYLAFVLAGIPVYYITQRNEGAPTGVQGEFSRELRVRGCVCADDVARVLWESRRADARTASARHGLGSGGDGRGRAVGDADTCSIAFGRARVYFWEGRIWTEVFLDPWILRKCNEACCSALQRALAGRQVNVSRSLS